MFNPPVPATGNWIDVPGMSLTTNGLMQPQLKGDFFRLHRAATTGTPNIKYSLK